MNGAAVVRAGLLAATLLLPGTGSAAGPATPEAAILAARAAASRGDVAAGLRGLEAALARSPSPPDALALRLEAARLAVAAGERDRAAAHVAALERLLPLFAQAPSVLPRLQREAARLRQQLGDPRRAEPLLAAAAEGLRPSDPDAAGEALNALGMAQVELLRPNEAAATFQRAASLAGTGKWRATLLVNLGNALLEAGDLDGARAALAGAEGAALDPAARNGAQLLRAQLLLRDVRPREAEALLEEAVAAAPDAASRGHALALLANSRFDRGRMPEALRAGLGAAAAYQDSLGPWHPALGRTLHLLGTASGELRDRAGAAAFFARASAIARRAFGPQSSQVAATEIEWAGVELLGGDLRAAERRIAGLAPLPAPADPADARLAGLAQVLRGLVAEARGEQGQAVERFRDAQRLIGLAGALGEVDLSFSEIRLGRLLTRMGRFGEAAPPIDRTVARHERLGSGGSARHADALLARAELRAAQGNRRGALEDGRTAYAGLRARLEAGEAPDEGGAFRRGARDVLAAHARLLVQLGGGDPGLLQEAFEVTQAALASRAGDALRLSAMRRAGGPRTEALLRARDDAAEGLRQVAALERAALQREGPEAAREATRLRAVQAERAQALAALDRQLATLPGSFPGRTAVGLQAVRAALDAETAAIVTLGTSDGSLVWTLSREGVSADLVPMTEGDLAALVRRVRSGVDLRPGSTLPPFDVDAARRLHRVLIGPGRSLTDGKRRLLLVPDGALQSIPPTLLVGDEPQGWLVRRFALAVVPSVGGLATGDPGERSAAPLAFLGVGDPHLSAADRPRVPVASRGLPPDVRDVLAGLQPLPETRDELRRIADLFPAGDTRLVLGDAATKEGVAAATPAAYRYVAFATHAVMAGELPGIAEPAIILSTAGPDPAAGLLGASDVARMTLDADLVLLSACNTAAPDGGPYAEGMSGLARAFLYAGARSLLVSHWAVDSRATVQLTTGFMAALRAEPGRSKADALRTASLALLDGNDPALRHPAMWAPFALVNDR